MIHPGGKFRKRGLPRELTKNGTDIPSGGWFLCKGGEWLPFCTSHDPWTDTHIIRTTGLSTKNAYLEHFGDHVFRHKVCQVF